MKGKLIVYIEEAIILRLASEAERRHVSMSTIAREALDLASERWEAAPVPTDSQLTGQADIYGQVVGHENGA